MTVLKAMADMTQSTRWAVLRKGMKIISLSQKACASKEEDAEGKERRVSESHSKMMVSMAQDLYIDDYMRRRVKKEVSRRKSAVTSEAAVDVDILRTKKVGVLGEGA